MATAIGVGDLEDAHGALAAFGVGPRLDSHPADLTMSGHILGAQERSHTTCAHVVDFNLLRKCMALTWSDSMASRTSMRLPPKPGTSRALQGLHGPLMFAPVTFLLASCERLVSVL